MKLLGVSLGLLVLSTACGPRTPSTKAELRSLDIEASLKNKVVLNGCETGLDCAEQEVVFFEKASHTLFERVYKADGYISSEGASIYWNQRGERVVIGSVSEGKVTALKGISLKVPANSLGPVAWPGDSRYPYVVRGGSWDDRAPALRSAARRASNEEWNRRDPQSPQSIWWHTDATFVGFRVVRAVEEQDNLKGLRSRITPASR